MYLLEQHYWGDGDDTGEASGTGSGYGSGNWHGGGWAVGTLGNITGGGEGNGMDPTFVFDMACDMGDHKLTPEHVMYLVLLQQR